MNDKSIKAPERRLLTSRLGACALIAAVGWLMPLAAAAQTTIKFIAWNFQVETVNEFVKQFEAENPGIKVDLEIIPSAQYAAKIQLMKMLIRLSMRFMSSIMCSGSGRRGSSRWTTMRVRPSLKPRCFRSRGNR